MFQEKLAVYVIMGNVMLSQTGHRALCMFDN